MFNNEHITRKRIAETCLLRICVSASLQFGRFIAEAIEVAYGFGGAFAFDTCFIAFRITLLVDPPVFWNVVELKRV